MPEFIIAVYSYKYIYIYIYIGIYLRQYLRQEHAGCGMPEFIIAVYFPSLARASSIGGMRYPS